MHNRTVIVGWIKG